MATSIVMRPDSRFGFVEVTPAQYETIERAVTARHLCGDSDVGDSILAELLLSGRSMYQAWKAAQAT